MSSSTYIPYYKKQIERFNALAAATNDPDKKAFNEAQAKMLSGRMMDLKIQELKECSDLASEA
tara:strand:+ start:877 stop:1065 length:189 start_codon:yes stop_codon:yes gene_type:complete